MPPARETLDAKGLHILPGAIDVHVHFRDPGYPHKEDWESGTAAAAFGGVTCVFDMPNTIPPTADGKILADKHAIAAGKAHIDFGLYGLLGNDNLATVPELIDGGIIGFKLYMGNTFGKIASPSTGAMLEAFEVVAATGKRVSLHAETNSIMERRETRMRQAGRIDPLAHIASRPAVVAVEAVSRAAILAEWTGARIHILHISSAEELRPLREAKARGVDITGETCPHYLMLSADDYARFAGVIRVNPPVREKRNQEPLWAALADGTVDLIATDHAPHSREEKTRNDMFDVDCGFPGVETQMPLMLTAVNDGEPAYRGLYANLGVADKPVYPRAEHPVVRTHPVTGKKALYVNRGFTSHIVGIPRDESDAILRYLYEHCENPLFQCRFRWTENAIAFWDNRCTQHRAMWDYWPHTRSGTRVTCSNPCPTSRYAHRSVRL